LIKITWWLNNICVKTSVDLLREGHITVGIMEGALDIRVTAYPEEITSLGLGLVTKA
jgi:hypothetical protein